MKKLMLLIGSLLCGTVALARPQFIEPAREVRIDNLRFTQADVYGDWILARGLYMTNIDPNDPNWSFDWWEKVVLFHRAPSGDWQLVQTLADEYLIFNSDEHYPDPHDLVLKNGVAAFSTNTGLRIFHLSSGVWVPRTVVGASDHPPEDLDFDGTTLLASDGSCSPAAKAFTRQADGRWVAQSELVGMTVCEEFFRRELAVSGTRALVLEDGPNDPTTFNYQVRVFERSGTAWLPGNTLPPPPTFDPFFGAPLALRGDVALVGGNVTNVYRRDASGFTHAGQIPLLVATGDRPWALEIAIGPYFAMQTYPGPSTFRDLAVLQPNSSGGYDHVATMGGPYEQHTLNISGRRVVTTSAVGQIAVYDLPQTFTPTTATLHDFENGTQGLTALAGQFAVAQRGSTRVYRQSSLAGDAVAVDPTDRKTTLITADVRPTAFDGSTRWVGLMARYIDENNMYYLTIRDDSSVRIRKKVNGVITELGGYGQFPPVSPLGTHYRASFEVVGNRLSYYRNGQLISQTYDPDHSLSHGRAGVRTYRATADFDNVIITPVPLMELAGGFSYPGLVDIVDGSWTATDNFDATQSSTSGNARILHASPTDDQVVKFTTRITSIGTDTSGSHWAGAMVRYTDPSNYYYVTLRTSNEISLRKVVNGVVTELDRDAVPLQVGTPYRLRVEAIGTKLIVYLNDQVRLEARDSSHAQGRAGYVTFRAAASFSGYSAWQP
jgi:hypothetical protein